MIQNFVPALICHFSALDHGTAKLTNNLSLEYELWWYNLKGLFLSIQKTINILTFDPQNWSYGSWKIPQIIN